MIYQGDPLPTSSQLVVVVRRLSEAEGSLVSRSASVGVTNINSLLLHSVDSQPVKGKEVVVTVGAGKGLIKPMSVDSPPVQGKDLTVTCNQGAPKQLEIHRARTSLLLAIKGLLQLLEVHRFKGLLQ